MHCQVEQTEASASCSSYPTDMCRQCDSRDKDYMDMVRVTLTPFYFIVAHLTTMQGYVSITGQTALNC